MLPAFELSSTPAPDGFSAVAVAVSGVAAVGPSVLASWVDSYCLSWERLLMRSNILHSLYGCVTRMDQRRQFAK